MKTFRDDKQGASSRREFLKQMALAVAGSVLTGGRIPVAASASAGPEGLTWQKAPCRFCGTGCGVLVGVKDGRVVAVQGDVESPVNRGLLCAKGYHVGLALYGRDRLTTPLLRRNGKLEPTTWEEAIDRIAREILRSPSTFAFYGSGQWTICEGYAVMKFMKGGLSNNHVDPNARLCMASAVVGMLTTYGVDEPSGCYDDFDLADTVILWGNNMAEMHPVLWSRIVDRRTRGEKVEIIDLATRRTRTTEEADHYIEFKPQGDLAIANGICHLLIKSGRYDREWVTRHCHFRKGGDAEGEPMTFEEFAEWLETYTPEYVRKVAGVRPDQLQLLADRFADPQRRVLSLWCMGVNQHTRGTWMNNLIYNVHFLSGKFGKPGSTAFSLTGQPSACGTCREVGTLGHALPGGRLVANEEHRRQCEELWKLPPGRLNPTPGHHAVALFEALARGELTGVWIQVTNPAQSLPHLGKLTDRLRERFVVVSDVYPTATTELATVVLPSAMWVEKNGMYGNSERRTQQWFKMVEPPGQARDDVWQVIAVARRLYELGHPGMKNRDGEFLFTYRDETGRPLEIWNWEVFRKVNVDRLLYEEYRPFTEMKKYCLAPYDELVKARGLRWPVVRDASGQWRETARRFVEGEDPFVTPGRGVDFYWGKLKDGRALIWARPYEPPPEVPDDQYPFWLCTGRVLEHWHTGTMTRRVPQLHRAMPAAYVELNAEDAARLGIRNGDRVRIRSRRGEIVLPARIHGRGSPARGSVFVPFFAEESLINRLTLEAHCPLSKEPDYKKCAVAIEKV
ncbi:molybdopterin-dependent oxidoreductase [Limisphaera sp. VF-2]|uniref:molybdopterin-dependent oxidoreductase n=1 Tax=Limisphaera sp. VF-2 TaxID=3400418 RepID=UPI00176E8735